MWWQSRFTQKCFHMAARQFNENLRILGKVMKTVNQNSRPFRHILILPINSTYNYGLAIFFVLWFMRVLVSRETVNN